MRERVGHGEVGRRSGGDEGVRWRPGARPAAEPVAWRIGRRRGRGPRPVRPGRPVVAVRPPEVPRPGDRTDRPREQGWVGPSGPRLLIRRSAVRCGARHRLRRTVAGLGLVVGSAAVVVALGLLAGAVQPEGSPIGGPTPAAAQGDALAPSVDAPVVVTVQPGETVWEVASRVAPGLSGPQRAALAERIVTDNGLASVRPEPGRVLRVATR